MITFIDKELYFPNCRYCGKPMDLIQEFSGNDFIVREFPICPRCRKYERVTVIMGPDGPDSRQVPIIW